MVVISGKAIAVIIKANAKNYANDPVIQQDNITRGIKGAVVGLLNNEVGDFHRKLILAYLFKIGEKLEPISSKELEPAQWQALLEWVEPFKDEVTQKWRSARPNFSDEVAAVLTEAIREFYTETPQEAREKFGEYDAGSLVAATISFGGTIIEVKEGGAKHDDVVIKPTKVNPPEGFGNYLDKILFGDDSDLDDPVNF